jgi:hypothetical protein
MYARVTRIESSADSHSEPAVQFGAETLPALQAQEGFVGAQLFIDRPSGALMVVTFWRDQAALEASEASAAGLRDTVAGLVGATDPPRIETYELALHWPLARHLLHTRAGPDEWSAGGEFRQFDYWYPLGEPDSGAWAAIPLPTSLRCGRTIVIYAFTSESVDSCAAYNGPLGSNNPLCQTALEQVVSAANQVSCPKTCPDLFIREIWRGWGCVTTASGGGQAWGGVEIEVVCGLAI